MTTNLRQLVQLRVREFAKRHKTTPFMVCFNATASSTYMERLQLGKVMISTCERLLKWMEKRDAALEKRKPRARFSAKRERRRRLTSAGARASTLRRAA